MPTEDIMEMAAVKRKRVRVVCHDKEYIGEASFFTKGDDEEDGHPTFCVDTEDKGNWCFSDYDIESIEILD